MDSTSHINPSFRATAFHCPRCHVLARQEWEHLCGLDALQKYISSRGEYDGLERAKDANSDAFSSSQCAHCEKFSVWYRDQMIFPDTPSVESANVDLPTDVRQDYDEAAFILGRSPRGAAALLRLAIQKLCKELGQPGANINADIATLVQQGLPPGVQQALDTVRVIGNHAVHPGTIDLRDNSDTAAALFKLVNFIATKMISEPKELEALYGSLPEGSLSAIERRDSSTS